MDKIESSSKHLAHYGVKGMKWGVRKEEETTGTGRGRSSSGRITTTQRRGGVSTTGNRNAKIAGGIAGGTLATAAALPAARIANKVGNVISQYTAFGGESLRTFAERKAIVTRTRQTGSRALGSIMSKIGRSGMKLTDILSPALAKGGVNAVRLMSRRNQAIRFLAIAGIAAAGTAAGIEIADDLTEKDND